jgi:hypothetical protein
MSKEVPLQYDMFSGGLVDNRTSRQKKQQRQQIQPKQIEMFTPREVLQFGVKARPTMPLVTEKGMPVGMKLEIQDPRTEEEKEWDRMKAAERQTHPMFEAATQEQPAEPQRTKLFPSGLRLPLVDVEEPEPDIAIQLYEDVNILYWSTRDQEYERARDGAWRRGYRVYTVENDQLEIWNQQGSEYFLITYSDIVENIEICKGKLL